LAGAQPKKQLNLPIVCGSLSNLKKWGTITTFYSNIMKNHGKKFRESQKKVNPETTYALDEALKLATETSTVKFDATVEIHINTGTNPKYNDQMIRSTVVMPHGSGKTQRIAVFCTAENEEAAKKAGADLVGSDELIEKINKGEIDFDIAIAEPAMMKNLAKAAKVLGPKGLMPSPKAGTVTDNLAEAIGEIKKGKIEFRNDKFGIVHSILGKVSFGANKLTENAQSFLAALKEVKPEGTKGSYIRKITITTTMGPGIKVGTHEVV
jgi:large subunit ribosomal protein L1